MCAYSFFHLEDFANDHYYQYYVPKGKVGHVVKGIPLSRVKDRLDLVRGSLVEYPLVSSFGRHHFFFLFFLT